MSPAKKPRKIKWREVDVGSWEALVGKRIILSVKLESGQYTWAFWHVTRDTDDEKYTTTFVTRYHGTAQRLWRAKQLVESYLD